MLQYLNSHGFTMAGFERLCQRVGPLEKAGWPLIGIIPGFDRELVNPGEVKRVFEAIYVKVLVTEQDFLRPSSEGMTPATRSLFKHLYPGRLPGTEAWFLAQAEHQIMASDSGHTRRVLEALGDRQRITEKAMFGGRAVPVDGKMFVGIQEPTLMARVGPGRHQDAASVRSASERRAAMPDTALEPAVP